MADYNLKVITSDTDGPSADTELLFGSPDQSSGTPKSYSFGGIKMWVQSWSSRWGAGAGVGLTWTTAITGSTLNSLANTSCLLSDVAISNGTALDRNMDLSLILGSLTPVGVGANISIHLYPTGDTGAYGDGKFGTAAAGPCNYPPVATFPLVVATQAQSGVFVGVVLPPGTFKLVVCNNAGANFAASGNTLLYRTYN